MCNLATVLRHANANKQKASHSWPFRFDLDEQTTTAHLQITCTPQRKRDFYGLIFYACHSLSACFAINHCFYYRNIHCLSKLIVLSRCISHQFLSQYISPDPPITKVITHTASFPNVYAILSMFTVLFGKWQVMSRYNNSICYFTSVNNGKAACLQQMTNRVPLLAHFQLAAFYHQMFQLRPQI